MFRRDPEPFESYCESAICHKCGQMRKESKRDLEPYLRMPRPALSLTILGAWGIESVGLREEDLK